MSAPDVLQQAEAAGVKVWAADGHIRYQPKDAPSDLVDALRKHKPELLELLKPHRDWILEVWAREVTPEWERILEESIAIGDHRRADYAYWMLQEVLGVNPDEVAQ